VLAEFAIGEAVDDRTGTVCVTQDDDSTFSVWVVNGLLPDGSEQRQYTNAWLAMTFALGIARQLCVELSGVETL
jgi:hypothetical protein